jgi:hypothetical protein
MIAFAKTHQGNTENFLMLVNFERGASLIPVSQVETASSRPGIETPVPFGQISALDMISAPLAGTLRVDNLDDELKGQWLIGWSGSEGGTFSNFDPLVEFEKKTPEKTVRYIRRKLL